MFNSILDIYAILISESCLRNQLNLNPSTRFCEEVAVIYYRKLRLPIFDYTESNYGTIDFLESFKLEKFFQNSKVSLFYPCCC
jgi:hypothetical protein